MPPSQTEFSASALKILPVIITYRDPVDWALSVFKFFRKNYNDYNKYYKFEDFLRDPFIVFDKSKYIADHCPKYFFKNIFDYYNFYYLSWTEQASNANIYFLKTEELNKDPYLYLSELLPEHVHLKKNIRLPEAALLPSTDGQVSLLASSFLHKNKPHYEQYRAEIYDLIDPRIKARFGLNAPLRSLGQPRVEAGGDNHADRRRCEQNGKIGR